MSIDIARIGRRLGMRAAKALLELSCRVQGRTIQLCVKKGKHEDAMRIRADQLHTLEMIQKLEKELES